MNLLPLRSVGRCAWGTALFLLGLCAPGAAVLRAEEPGDLTAYRDLRHAILARQALLKDPALAPLNVGVKVHNRVAVLWGPIPSEELRQRAVKVLRKLPDLLEVRDELHLLEPDMNEPPPRFLPDALPPPVVPVPRPVILPGFAQADDPWRGLLTRRPVEAPTPTDTVRLRPAPPVAPPAVAEVPAGPGEVVLPVIMVPLPSAPGAVSGSSLEDAVNQVRAGDRRFLGLQTAVRDGEVRLSGRAARGEDLQDFARLVARLPGVERVIVGNVRID